MHCFGHIHEGWGTKLVTWRDRTTATPSHLTDIDNGQTCTIAKLSDMKCGGQSLSGDDAPIQYFATSHCSGDAHPLNWGSQTLSVNAAIEGLPQSMDNHQQEILSMQLPWVVDLELRSSQ
jgi:hypothetical protein